MENLLYGLEVTAIGLVVVFFGLALLVAIIKGMTAIMHKDETPAPKAAPAIAPAVAPVEQPVAEEIVSVSDDSEIVAAIMAALSCVYAGTGKTPVVRSVRRSSADWKRAYR